jgi:hypothetical protein
MHTHGHVTSSLRESLRNISNDKMRDLSGRVRDSSLQNWLPLPDCATGKTRETVVEQMRMAVAHSRAKNLKREA